MKLWSDQILFNGRQWLFKNCFKIWAVAHTQLYFITLNISLLQSFSYLNSACRHKPLIVFRHVQGHLQFNLQKICKENISHAETDEYEHISSAVPLTQPHTSSASSSTLVCSLLCIICTWLLCNCWLFQCSRSVSSGPVEAVQKSDLRSASTPSS